MNGIIMKRPEQQIKQLGELLGIFNSDKFYRHKYDSGLIYLFDSRFSTLKQSNLRPTWMKSSSKEYSNFE